jgi:LysM repeat protein
MAVASRHSITPDALAAANDITDVNNVLVGQVLKIPAPVP